MIKLRVAVAILAATLSLFADAARLAAIWSADDAEGKFTLELRSDATCRLTTESKALGELRHIDCGYWVVGSTIHLRTSGQHGDEGLGKLRLEYVRQSDTVIVRGRTPRTLVRQPIVIDG